MGTSPLSEEKMVEQLGTVKRLLAEIEGQLLQPKIPSEQPRPIEPESVDSISVIEELADVLRETGEQIVARMDARGERLDRLENLEARLRIVELLVSQKSPNGRSVIQDMPARDFALKAPTRPAPIDYTPIFNTAIHAVRDIGISILNRYRESPPNAQPPDKSS